MARIGQDQLKYATSKLKSCYEYFDMGLTARKPVFGVSDKASFKPVSSATDTS